MLILKNIDVTLGQHTPLARKVLDRLNVTVKEGEFVVVIGNNGAGKSTMFNVISGFIKPDAGQVFMGGQDVTQMAQTYRARLVSKVVQDPKMGTMENMSLFENMAFAFKRGQKRGLTLFSNQKRREFFKEKLRMLNMGLENRLDAFVSHLSGGQRQALSLIMATLQEAQILLLDEITAALDPASSASIMELTDRIIRQNKQTCMMITHNMAHAIQHGDRVLLLKNGTFVKDYDAAAKSRLTPAEIAIHFGEKV